MRSGWPCDARPTTGQGHLKPHGPDCRSPAESHLTNRRGVQTKDAAVDHRLSVHTLRPPWSVLQDDSRRKTRRTWAAARRAAATSVAASAACAAPSAFVSTTTRGTGSGGSSPHNASSSPDSTLLPTPPVEGFQDSGLLDAVSGLPEKLVRKGTCGSHGASSSPLHGRLRSRPGPAAASPLPTAVCQVQHHHPQHLQPADLHDLVIYDMRALNDAQICPSSGPVSSYVAPRLGRVWGWRTAPPTPLASDGGEALPVLPDAIGGGDSTSDGTGGDSPASTAQGPRSVTASGPGLSPAAAPAPPPPSTPSRLPEVWGISDGISSDGGGFVGSHKRVTGNRLTGWQRNSGDGRCSGGPSSRPRDDSALHGDPEGAKGTVGGMSTTGRSGTRCGSGGAGKGGPSPAVGDGPSGSTLASGGLADGFHRRGTAGVHDGAISTAGDRAAVCIARASACVVGSAGLVGRAASLSAAAADDSEVGSAEAAELELAEQDRPDRRWWHAGWDGGRRERGATATAESADGGGRNGAALPLGRRGGDRAGTGAHRRVAAPGIDHRIGSQGREAEIMQMQPPCSTPVSDDIPTMEAVRSAVDAPGTAVADVRAADWTSVAGGRAILRAGSRPSLKPGGGAVSRPPAVPSPQPSSPNASAAPQPSAAAPATHAAGSAREAAHPHGAQLQSAAMGPGTAAAAAAGGAASGRSGCGTALKPSGRQWHAVGTRAGPGFRGAKVTWSNAPRATSSWASPPAPELMDMSATTTAPAAAHGHRGRAPAPDLAASSRSGGVNQSGAGAGRPPSVVVNIRTGRDLRPAPPLTGVGGLPPAVLRSVRSVSELEHLVELYGEKVFGPDHVTAALHALADAAAEGSTPAGRESGLIGTAGAAVVSRGGGGGGVRPPAAARRGCDHASIGPLLSSSRTHLDTAAGVAAGFQYQHQHQVQAEAEAAAEGHPSNPPAQDQDQVQRVARRLLDIAMRLLSRSPNHHHLQQPHHHQQDPQHRPQHHKPYPGPRSRPGPSCLLALLLHLRPLGVAPEPGWVLPVLKELIKVAPSLDGRQLVALLESLTARHMWEYAPASGTVARRLMLRMHQQLEAALPDLPVDLAARALGAVARLAPRGFGTFLEREARRDAGGQAVQWAVRRTRDAASATATGGEPGRDDARSGGGGGGGRLEELRNGHPAVIAAAARHMDASFAASYMSYIRTALSRGAVSGEDAVHFLDAIARFAHWPGVAALRNLGDPAAAETTTAASAGIVEGSRPSAAGSVSGPVMGGYRKQPVGAQPAAGVVSERAQPAGKVEGVEEGGVLEDSVEYQSLAGPARDDEALSLLLSVASPPPPPAPRKMYNLVRPVRRAVLLPRTVTPAAPAESLAAAAAAATDATSSAGALPRAPAASAQAEPGGSSPSAPGHTTSPDGAAAAYFSNPAAAAPPGSQSGQATVPARPPAPAPPSSAIDPDAATLLDLITLVPTPPIPGDPATAAVRSSSSSTLSGSSNASFSVKDSISGGGDAAAAIATPVYGVDLYCWAFWALVRLGVRPSAPWVGALLAATQPALPSLDPGLLARVWWALCVVRWAPAAAWRAEAMAALRAAAAALAPDEVCMVLGGFGLWPDHPGRSWVDGLLTRAQSLLPAFHATSCTALAFALARMGHRPRASVLLPFLQQCSAQLPYMDGRNLVNLLWALRRLHLHVALPSEWRWRFLTACRGLMHLPDDLQPTTVRKTPQPTSQHGPAGMLAGRAAAPAAGTLPRRFSEGAAVVGSAVRRSRSTREGNGADTGYGNAAAAAVFVDRYELRAGLVAPGSRPPASHPPLTPSQLALLLLLVAKCDLAPGRVWRGEYWRASEAALSYMPPVALAALLNGVWRLRVSPPLRWMRAFFAASGAALSGMTPVLLVQLARLLLRVPMRPRGAWVRAFRARVESQMAAMSRGQLDVCARMTRLVSHRRRRSAPPGWLLRCARDQQEARERWRRTRLAAVTTARRMWRRAPAPAWRQRLGRAAEAGGTGGECSAAASSASRLSRPYAVQGRAGAMAAPSPPQPLDATAAGECVVKGRCEAKGAAPGGDGSSTAAAMSATAAAGAMHGELRRAAAGRAVRGGKGAGQPIAAAAPRSGGAVETGGPAVAVHPGRRVNVPRPGTSRGPGDGRRKN